MTNQQLVSTTEQPGLEQKKQTIRVVELCLQKLHMLNNTTKHAACGHLSVSIPKGIRLAKVSEVPMATAAETTRSSRSKVRVRPSASEQSLEQQPVEGRADEEGWGDEEEEEEPRPSSLD